MTVPNLSWASRNRRTNEVDGPPLKRGDRVIMLQARHWPLFAHRRRRKTLTGQVMRVNGGNVLVRPSWCAWEAHCYSWELRLV